jgi:hypothetical protein
MAFHVTPSSTNVAFEPLRQQVQTLLIVRLVPGNEKNTCRHLQQLYHKQLINRFAFVQGKNFTEFYCYLDNTEALDLFVDHGVQRRRSTVE